MAEIVVLGAGMVGIGAALALQARGHDVTVLDRREPGRETSYGNAGLIQQEAAEPYAIPHEPSKLWHYAIGDSNDLVYHVPAVLKTAGPLWSYFRASATRRHRLIAQTYSRLTGRSTADHAPLIEAAGAQALVQRTGFYQMHRDPRAFDKAVGEAARLRATYGVESRVLDGAALMTEEPALRREVAGAVHWTDPWAVKDPGGLVAAYARLFVDRGGRVVNGDAQTLTQDGGGWQVRSAEGPLQASDVVVALGPWTPELLGRFGYRVPMVWKRGYHRHFRVATALNRPIQDAANGVLLSPMVDGLRIATGAELVDRDAPRNLRQLERGLAGARELMEVGEPVNDDVWVGHRPCMPDMLPVVGPAPKHKGLWFDFGHGHQGFTLGPTTGEILAAMFAGETDDDVAKKLGYGDASVFGGARYG
ncbi:NAD(P)/FAD-dependent oxidoreductase [Acidihalobacter ferrooxydans]|uniref:Amino acid dehydrogenase n=1 Tax=Acidihalobacter ferrooxydans TaxID=1765967 RepID=A0A1P8UJW5_9GAMM|nr:FAD-dependent oxidoreductase [Acidihalobacter ferrooxydans]APZ44052.1 amino acid dehydrogenase [Acidihalobacter ferrooxydans]